jgi:hypothetical protein
VSNLTLWFARHSKTIARAGIAKAGGETTFADARLRILTNAVTSLDLNEMTASDEDHSSRRARRTAASPG